LRPIQSGKKWMKRHTGRHRFVISFSFHQVSFLSLKTTGPHRGLWDSAIELDQITVQLRSAYRSFFLLLSFAWRWF
jgi:hypothetical protein